MDLTEEVNLDLKKEIIMDYIDILNFANSLARIRDYKVRLQAVLDHLDVSKIVVEEQDSWAHVEWERNI